MWTESYRIMKGCTCGSQAAASGAVRFEGAQLQLLPQAGVDTHCSPTLPLGLLRLVTGPHSAEGNLPYFQHPISTLGLLSTNSPKTGKLVSILLPPVNV